MIPDEAVEAANEAMREVTPPPGVTKAEWLAKHGEFALIAGAIAAAAPHLLSHEREQTRLAHLDAIVNRETKQAELAAAWDEGYRECYERQMYEPVPVNPYRKPTDA